MQCMNPHKFGTKLYNSKAYKTIPILKVTEEKYMKTKDISAKSMNVLKLRSNHPESIKEMIESDLAKRLQIIEVAIQTTHKKLKQFESQYQWSTEKFVNLFTSDQLQHSLDFDEWLGEAWMLEKLQQKQAIIKEIEFVD